MQCSRLGQESVRIGGANRGHVNDYAKDTYHVRCWLEPPHMCFEETESIQQPGAQPGAQTLVHRRGAH